MYPHQSKLLTLPIYQLSSSKFITTHTVHLYHIDNKYQMKKFSIKKPPNLGGHAVHDAELQMVDDALHAVIALLPGGPQVLLHGPCHGGKDGLGGLPGVHHLPRVFGRGCR